VGFLSILAVFSSTMIMNEHSILGKPFKLDKKDISKKIDRIREKIKNNNEDIKERIREKIKNNNEDKKQEDSKKTSVNKKTSVDYNYNFADEGDNKRKNFNFAAVGDSGCSKNAKNTVSNMNDKKPELVLPLGDLSYDKTAKCWLNLISPFSDKLKVTLGFHDVNDGGSKLKQYEQAFGLDKLYGSFDYRHVHFVTMASESTFDKGSAQYKFIDEDLKKASENKDIDWIVVTTYGPFYTSPSTHKAEKGLRDIYHPLFEKYNVDLVLQAHNHNYQRTYPISYNSAGDSSEPTVTNQLATGYNSHTDGTVFALVGTGGESFYPLNSQAPYVASQFDKFGFLNIDISNGNPHTKLTGTFYDNKADNVLDQFTIEKEIKSK
jgi:calcineurin-like phosphoesterase family protein